MSRSGIRRMKKKIVKRKNSNILWEVWYETKEEVCIMNYSQFRQNSRRITRKNFNKYWEVI